MKPKFKVGDTFRYKGNIYTVKDITWYGEVVYVYEVTCLVNNFPDEDVVSSIGRAGEDNMKPYNLENSDKLSTNGKTLLYMYNKGVELGKIQAFNSLFNKFSEVGIPNTLEEIRKLVKEIIDNEKD